MGNSTSESTQVIDNVHHHLNLGCHSTCGYLLRFFSLKTNLTFRCLATFRDFFTVQLVKFGYILDMKVKRITESFYSSMCTGTYHKNLANWIFLVEIWSIIFHGKSLICSFPMLPLSTNSHMSLCPGQFFVEIKIG